MENAGGRIQALKKPSARHRSVQASLAAGYNGMLSEVSGLLEAARCLSARTVNAVMTATYWEIGRRIVEYEQGGRDRAEYGVALLKRLSVDLTTRFGRGFSERNLEQMRLFYDTYRAISQTVSAKSVTGAVCTQRSSERSQTPPAKSLSGQSVARGIRQTASAKFAALSNNVDFETLARRFPLPWSHYVLLLTRSRSPEARAFYEAEALRGGWSVRQLARQIDTEPTTPKSTG